MECARYDDSVIQAGPRIAQFDIMLVSTVPCASHMAYAYLFVSSDGIVHEGSDDDGEHDAGRAYAELGRSSIKMVRSKIAARRFSHIKDVGVNGKDVSGIPRSK